VIVERNPQVVLALEPVETPVGISDPFLVPRAVECLNAGVHHRCRLDGLLIESRFLTAACIPALIADSGEVSACLIGLNPL
jgi:hypothetical protein